MLDKFALLKVPEAYHKLRKFLDFSYSLSPLSLKSLSHTNCIVGIRSAIINLELQQRLYSFVFAWRSCDWYRANTPEQLWKSVTNRSINANVTTFQKQNSGTVIEALQAPQKGSDACRMRSIHGSSHSLTDDGHNVHD